MIQLFLSTLLHIINHAFYSINASFCFIMLIIAILTTHNTPLNLASMAVERYISICMPLRYGQLCTIKRTYFLIGLIWVVSLVFILSDISILLATEPLQFFHSQLLCLREHVFRSAYGLKKRDVSHIICLLLVWLMLFYTYLKIIFAAKRATTDTTKAKNTIVLHGFQLLLCMLNYVRPMLEQGLLHLLPTQGLAIRFVCYVIVHILPRFVSPIVYGLRDQTFRKYIRRYMTCSMNSSSNELPVSQK